MCVRCSSAWLVQICLIWVCGVIWACGGMGSLSQLTMKEIRSDSLREDPEWIVSYGRLRTDAIALMARRGGYDEAAAAAIGADGFRVWLQARQDKANAMLFPEAVPTLRTLKEQGYLIGAITNGNGDPREVRERTHALA